ncbi:N-alpha-acetyltransferase 15, auxiliary subunit [Paramuricea clavata]|uniref:N-alpha-acetyltransferase 15, auxiliary subunit n=1 Tax=Paramuricea clavata TaxID=317549 RepID=A0A6S7FN15_PARCT|nr:N-alpha-acetyltransferase 15, auxiliary subunit [Paramuricea clavata]
MRNQGPLYLTIIQRPKNDDVWYTKVRMGQNTTGKIMPRMTSSLESSTAKKLSNHSTRKTVVQKLKSAGQPRYKIKEITGHASEASLNNYDVISEEERRELSHIISAGYSASASRTTTSVPSIVSSSTAPRPTEHDTSIVLVQFRQQIASASNAILRQEDLF